MNTQIKLYRNNWTTGNSVHTIGWASWQNKCYSGEEFHQQIISLVNKDTFDMEEAGRLVNELNGSFALIIECNEKIYLIADRTRSYPILYTTINGVTYITDDLLSLFCDYKIQPEVDLRQAEIFLLSSLAWGEHTVFKDIYGIQASEIVQLSGQEPEIKRKRYFIYKLNTTDKQHLIPTEEAKKQNIIFTHIFQRMLDSAPNVHNWVIPLSGGHDSRMVINQMHKLGVKNIICFTYGEAGNRQSSLSKQVAEALGYPWYYVEYNAEKWGKLRKSADFNNYFDFAFNGMSNPHIQDLLAVSELKSKGILHPDDIFVPGHTYDFITGSQCLRGISEIKSAKGIIDYLKYSFNQWSYKQRSPVLYEELLDMMSHTTLPPNNFTEYYMWQEWHCKFLLNSVRVYEYFGFDWRTPLWDQELVTYWQSLHLDYKLYRNFLYKCEQDGLYEEPLLSIPFDYRMNPEISLMKRVMQLIPYSLIRVIKHHIRPKALHLDDGLYHVYAHQAPTLTDIVPYNRFPKELRYYLAPYVNRPLCWFPDNDNNSLYALRNIFIS